MGIIRTDLPSTHHFEGWDIRYNLARSRLAKASSTNQRYDKCVVFVHGTPWSSAVFQPIADALLATGSYQILLYDLPGYGQSQGYSPGSAAADTSSKPKFVGDTSVKFQARALQALLEHTQLDGKDGHPRPAVIAHDIAGAIVLRAHLLHMCEYDSMMLLDTNAVLPWGDGFYKLARANPEPFLLMPPVVYEAVVRSVIKSACHNQGVLLRGWEDTLVQPWIDSPAPGTAGAMDRQNNFVRQIAQANDQDVAEMLERNAYEDVRCDVKVVWGEEDQWIPRTKIEELIQRLKGKVKATAFIPAAGHLVMLDQPERITAEVLQWLIRLT